MLRMASFVERPLSRSDCLPGVERGEGEAGEEGPGAGRQVQAVPRGNDPASGKSFLRHSYKNNIMIDLITRMIISMIIRVSGSKLEVAEMSLTGRVVS